MTGDGMLVKYLIKIFRAFKCNDNLTPIVFQAAIIFKNSCLFPKITNENVSENNKNPPRKPPAEIE